MRKGLLSMAAVAAGVRKLSALWGNRLYFSIWLAVTLFMLGGMCDLPAASVLPGGEAWSWVQVSVMAVAKATLLVGALWLCKTYHRRIPGIALWIFVTADCFFGLVNFVGYRLYGLGISIRLMSVIGQTNFGEVMEFLPGLSANILSALRLPSFWIGAVLAAALFVAVPRLGALRYFGRTMLGATACGILWTAVLLMIMPICRTDLILGVRVGKNIVRNIRDQMTMAAIMDKLKTFPVLSETESSRSAVNFCLIIGESASRGHLGVYGYPLPTTPCASQLRDSLFIFEDALASSTATVSNLDRILSFMSDSDREENWYDYPLLVDLMNSAGYKTFWISNQEKSGIWNTHSSAQTANASVVKFMGAQSSEDHLVERYDEVLLPHIAAAFGDTARAKFIGVHLLGSHTLYYRRYPGSFNKFSGEDISKRLPRPWLTGRKAQTVAEYDNSILYTDYILARIIEMARRSREPSVVIYLSDHGENVYDDRDFNGRDPHYAKVPFIVYVNTAYRIMYPGITAQLSSATERPFSTADIIHSIMTLTSTSSPLYSPQLDVLSEGFRPASRYVDGKEWH